MIREQLSQDALFQNTLDSENRLFHWTFFRMLNQLFFQKFHQFILKILEFSENLLEFSEKNQVLGQYFWKKFTTTEKIKKKFGFQLANY